MDTKIILGLGNPGTHYSKNRHNMGFRVLNHIRKHLPFAFSDWDKGNHCRICWGKTPKGKILLAKPQTYMNLSGRAALSLMTVHKTPPENILVVVDDLALPFGKIRLRASGSGGGHNGIKSVIESLGRTDFPRLRVGISSCPQGMDSADYVLSDFSPEEEKQINEILDTCSRAVECWLSEGIGTAMNRFN